MDSQETKKNRKTSAWLLHVRRYREEHPNVSYKQALKDAKATYVKVAKVAKKKKEKKVKKEVKK